MHLKNRSKNYAVMLSCVVTAYIMPGSSIKRLNGEITESITINRDESLLYQQRCRMWEINL